MASRLPRLKFFSGRSNLPLAKKIIDANGIKGSKINFFDFKNKEIKVKIEDSVRGEDVFILQTTAPDHPHKWMMELFIMAHTAKRASARRITAVMPYVYGSRQDRKTEPRSPITIQLMGHLLAAAGVDRLITVELHNFASVAAFGDIVVDVITSSKLFYPHIQHLFKDDTVVMSPDAGGVPRAKHYANRFNTELGFCYKAREEEGQAKVLSFNADVNGKNVVIVDDIIDSAGTLCAVVEAAKDEGAKNIYVVATHAILSGDALKNIANSSIDKVYISDSISHYSLPDIFEVISLGPLLAKTIKAVSADESVGDLFEKDK